jgi:hypothetical protein
MEYPLFSQNNNNWKNFKIPGTNLTIGKYGCCICDLAMLCKFCGYPETPLSLAPKLKFSNGAVYWDSISKIYPDIKFVKRIENPKTLELQQWLNSKNTAIAKINISGIPGKFVEHWVILWENLPSNDFLIGDPVKNTTGNLNNLYGQKNKIFAATFYAIPKQSQSQPPQNLDQTKELQNKINELQNKINQAIQILK